MKMEKLNSMKGWLMIIGMFLAVQAFGQQMNGMGMGHSRNPGNNQMGQMRMHRMAMIPNLTDDQKQKIEQFNLTFDKNTLQTRNQIREKEAHLRTLMTQDNPDQGQIDKLIEDIGSLRTSIRKERVSTDLKIRGLLTDDQKVIFDSHHGMGMMRHGGGWGRS